MKLFNLIIASCIIIIISCDKNNNNASIKKSDSLNENSQIKKSEKYIVDYNNFVGQSIEQFLSSMPYTYDKYVCFSEPPGILAGVSFYYGDTLIVRINTDHRFLNIKDDFNWSIDDLKKEKIAKIKLLKAE